jgi:hypothetical protein
MIDLERIKEIDHFKSRGLWEKVNTTEVGKKVVLKIRIGMKKFTDLIDVSLHYRNSDFTSKSLHFQDGSLKFFSQFLHCGIDFDHTFSSYEISEKVQKSLITPIMK